MVVSRVNSTVKPEDISIIREIVRLVMKDQHASSKRWRHTDSTLRDFWDSLGLVKATLPDAKDIDTTVLTQKNEGEQTTDRQMLEEIYRAVNKLNEKVFGVDKEKGVTGRTGKDQSRQPSSIMKHMKDRMRS